MLDSVAAMVSATGKSVPVLMSRIARALPSSGLSATFSPLRGEKADVGVTRREISSADVGVTPREISSADVGVTRREISSADVGVTRREISSADVGVTLREISSAFSLLPSAEGRRWP
jgi:hypothetical protein